MIYMAGDGCRIARFRLLLCSPSACIEGRTDEISDAPSDMSRDFLGSLIMVIAYRCAWYFIARSILTIDMAYAISPTMASAQTVPAIEEEAKAGESKDEDLALKLQNPVADLISVPFQSNYEGRIGPLGNGNRFTRAYPVKTYTHYI
jgi:hypothetical protein